MKYPTCPHCNYVFDEDETWNHKGRNEVNADDGDISDLDCPRCCGKFHVVCELSPSWAVCNEDGEVE